MKKRLTTLLQLKSYATKKLFERLYEDELCTEIKEAEEITHMVT